MKLVIVTGGRSSHCAAAVPALTDQGYFVSTCSREKTESIADLEMEQVVGYGRFIDACFESAPAVTTAYLKGQT